MKQTFLQSTLLLTMMALLLGSCSDKEDVLRLDDSDVLTFYASVGRSGITRGTLDGNFDGGEKVAVAMRVADANANGWPAARRYQAESIETENTVMLSHSPLAANGANDVPWRWPKNADAIEVKGWYTADQYRTAVNGEEFGVPVDQSGGRPVIQGYDFLFAPATTANDRTNASVKLDMWHQLCLVVISIESDENLFDDEEFMKSVRMFGTQWTQRATYTEPTDEAKLYGAWGTYGGTFTPETAFTEGVKPLLHSHSENGKCVVFAALIVPQQTRGRQLISFDLSGIHYPYTLPTAEEDAPDFLPGMVYYYNLRLPDKQLMVTADLWDYDPHITFDSPVNPWQGVDKSATYVKVTEWIRANHNENKVAVDPWLPENIPFKTDFWIVDWLSEDKTGVLDYITLRQYPDIDDIPVDSTDELKYCDGWFIYSGGASTTGYTRIGGGFAPPTYQPRTEGYIDWYICAWETAHNSVTSKNNKTREGAWAFRIDDNNRLNGETINVLRLKSGNGSNKSLSLYKRRKSDMPLTGSPDATATFNTIRDGEIVIAMLNNPLTFNYLEYLIIDAPNNTFYYDDDYREMFYCYANTDSWASFGSSLGIDVGHVKEPVEDTEGTWYITSCTDNVDKLTDARVAAEEPFAGYVYPLTMLARLRGHSFNAFRFLCNQPGSSFKVYAVKTNGEKRELGTVTVPADAVSGSMVTCRLMNNGNPVDGSFWATEYLLIDGGLSNFYSASGGWFSDYDTNSYLYGPEGYFTIPSTSAMGTWTWEGNQYSLLGVDVGYVNP